ncbi:MAG: transcription antitermination factor NusB [candidate division WOR-3 bacterium]|jgi:N utilization substance protein B
MIYPFHGRRLARAIVVETIYNAELLNLNIDEVFESISRMKKEYFMSIINEIKKEKIREKFIKDLENWDEILNFSKAIINSYKENKEKIEMILRENIKGDWDYERIFLLEKSILKTAVSELLALNTPYKVIISEALSIGDYFVSQEAVKLINAILDGIVKGLKV